MNFINFCSKGVKRSVMSRALEFGHFGNKERRTAFDIYILQRNGSRFRTLDGNFDEINFYL